MMTLYRFVELRSELSLYLANEYHNQPDTCVYLTKLQKSDSNNCQYHYKIYRLHNNELSLPIHLILRKNLAFSMSTNQSAEAAQSIDYWIEKDKCKENKLEYADCHTLGNIFTVCVELDKSGAALIKCDNLYPEMSSPNNHRCHVG
jgi:hypothetical protein